MTELQNGKMVFTFSKMNGTKKEKKRIILLSNSNVPILFRTLVLHYISKYLQTWEAKLGIQHFSAFQILREIDFGILKPQK